MRESIQKRVTAMGQTGLYDPRFEHDACGIGAVANIDGRADHAILEHGKQIILNLHHRGAAGADDVTGDGAGILFQLPDAFLRDEAGRLGVELPPPGQYAAGMVFSPKVREIQDAGRRILEESVAHYGMKVLGWRPVPVHSACLGPIAATAEPVILQVFVEGSPSAPEAFERRLFLARRRAGRTVRARYGPDGEDFYIPSLSSRTINYKGMFMAWQLFEYVPDPNGDSRNCAIKQVASGRFGVTINYLAHARELQIKMAQGAKPGEGGQLPGRKVTEEIARLRHSTPGVSLISPPPHHDIYSIEDLAQLIYDLKAAHPGVKVSVKLVSEIGVGTVAAGVAKGNADEVLISGHDGGTGASPLSSIKHAGCPWELGLAETQQVLINNGLRDRIRVQVDGQLKTGRDVVIGALLGADQFGFGTAALVCMGCTLLRKCHEGAYTYGIATQDPELRRRFAGKPEYIVRYMFFVAEEVRRWMARLGFRTFDEMIGRVDRVNVQKGIAHYKAQGLDFSRVFHMPDVDDPSRRRVSRSQVDKHADHPDRAILEKVRSAIQDKKPVKLDQPIRNIHRAVGATLSYEVARRYGSPGLPDGTIELTFCGSAGQSFGAFLAAGVTLRLIGESNDYLGKGLSGGRIIVQKPPEATYIAHRNIIVGNTVLYGATRGELFVNGMAGERFAVRNSGVTAVVEGVGDHGCEYMTGGCVVVLGETGCNFAAGMSGGIAYVLAEMQLFDTLCNLDMVDLETVWQEADKGRLRKLIEKHLHWTGSERAEWILQRWESLVGRFVKVIPIDYRQALEKMRQEEHRDTEMTPATEEVFHG